ncbi:MAG: serine hydrolase domain-containing protein [Planctomycetota bacterium]|nr:serine hydrolase domain-containing protein [Planctomycetota bacterium]
MTPTATRQDLSNRFVVLAAFLSASLCAADDRVLPVGDLNPDLGAEIRAVQTSLIDDEVTGSNVVIIWQDGEELHRSVVNSGREGDRDITDRTLFPIWSMSKPITIVAMMTLHEQGLFQWDDPVAKYIPCFAELSVREGDTLRPARTPLRIIDLMTHRSGFGYYTWDGLPPRNDEPHTLQTRHADLQSFCEVAADAPLAFDPGTDYLYGINQAILGRLVEVLSGQSFADYLETAIFEPLGMTETSFVLDEARRARFQPLWINAGNLKGYTHLLDEMNYDPDSRAHFGGEGLVSCPEDYARFCEMLTNDGIFRGERLISAESIDAMTTVHSTNIFPEMMKGMDMGFSVFVLRDPDAEGSRVPPGTFGWSGYHNTHFWIDQRNRVFGVFMTRAREFNPEIPVRLRQAVYGASAD